MKWLARVLCALFCTMHGVERLAAQARDAYVLRPGTFRVEAGGRYSSADDLFGVSGPAPLFPGLGAPLTPARLASLRPVEDAVSSFLAFTANGPGARPTVVRADDLSLGAPRIAAFLSDVQVPLRLSAGVAPRVQVGAALTLLRGRRLVQDFTLVDPTLGANPAPAANAALFARLGGNGAALGGMALLPTEQSPLGQELTRRVRAATGSAPRLPRADSAGGDAFLQAALGREFGLDSLRSRVGEWRPGDLELDARVSLIDGLGGVPFPTDSSGRAIRVAGYAGVRIPVGADADSATVLPFQRPAGLSGFHAGLVGDLFVGRSVWVTAEGRFASVGGGRVIRRTAPASDPLSAATRPVGVRWDPADTIHLRIAPRYRLAELITVGGEYAIAAVGGSTVSGEGVEAGSLDVEGGIQQAVGFGIGFTSIPAVLTGQTRLPMEVSLTYRRLLSGPTGTRREGSIDLSGSVLVTLFGRGLR